MAVTLVAPPLLRLSARPALPVAASCPAGQAQVAFRYVAGTSVHVIREDVLQLDWLPEFHQGRYQRYLHGLPDAGIVQKLENIDVPASLTSTYDLLSKRDLLLVTDRNQMPAGYGLASACGRWSLADDPAMQQPPGIFFADTIRLVEETNYAPGSEK